jgi:hypothetical protein
MFDDKLFFAPIGDKPQKVIDIGTGTGKKLRIHRIELTSLIRIMARDMGHGLW